MFSPFSKKHRLESEAKTVAAEKIAKERARIMQQAREEVVALNQAIENIDVRDVATKLYYAMGKERKR